MQRSLIKLEKRVNFSSLLLSVVGSVLLLQVVGCQQTVPQEGKEELSLLVLGPYPATNPSPGWDGGPALIPAARLAVELINNNSDILPNYKLTLSEADSGCNLVDKAFISFIDRIFHSPNSNVVGIIGPACSEATLALSNLNKRDQVNLMQVSTGTSPIINGINDINTFRTVSSSMKYVFAFQELMIKNNWSRVAAIYDNLRPYHIATFNSFRDLVNPSYSSGVDDFVFPDVLNEIRNRMLRVVFVFGGKMFVRKFVCLALSFERKMVYPEYQFLFIDRVQEDFTLKDPFRLNDVLCNYTDREMRMVTNGSVLGTFQFRRQNHTNIDTISGLSYYAYEQKYREKRKDYLDEIQLNETDLPATAESYFNAYFDATWALALALNESTSQVNLSEYRYGRQQTKEIGDVVRRNLLEEVSFEGMSGHISFDNVTRGVPGIAVFLNQSWFYYNDSGEFSTSLFIGSFSNGKISPKLQGEFILDDYCRVIFKIPLPLGITVLIVIVLITLFVVFLQIMFILYSNVKEVKATSPRLNHLIFSGCYLCLLALLVFTIQETFTECVVRNLKSQIWYGVGCSTGIWCTSMGFSLIFGTVCAKTWRLYRIFSHFRHGTVKFVSDTVLILFVLFLLLLDIGLLGSWNAVNPWILASRETIQNEQIYIRHYCECQNLTYWLVALFTYKGILMALVVYLSLLIRQVKRKGFKSTRNINMLIYSLIIIYFIGLTLYAFFLQSIPILSFMANIMMLSLGVLAVCLCLFLPSLKPIFTGKYTISATKTTFRPMGSLKRFNSSIRSNRSFSLSLSSTTNCSPMVSPESNRWPALSPTDNRNRSLTTLSPDSNRWPALSPTINRSPLLTSDISRRWSQPSNMNHLLSNGTVQSESSKFRTRDKSTSFSHPLGNVTRSINTSKTNCSQSSMKGH